MVVSIWLQKILLTIGGNIILHFHKFSNKSNFSVFLINCKFWLCYGLSILWSYKNILEKIASSECKGGLVFSAQSGQRFLISYIITIFSNDWAPVSSHSITTSYLLTNSTSRPSWNNLHNTLSVKPCNFNCSC